MKKFLCMVMVLSLLVTAFAWAEENKSRDFSALSDAEVLDLLTQVQQEVVSRKLQKTASLTMGQYVGGRDVPVGGYILSAAGTEDDSGIIYIAAKGDNLEEDYPSKLYEYVRGNKLYRIYIFIEEGDTLCLPFKCTLTVSSGLMFE